MIYPDVTPAFQGAVSQYVASGVSANLVAIFAIAVIALLVWAFVRIICAIVGCFKK